MTVIDGIEIDCLNYKMNDIKFSIKNNELIEEKLNVIIIISNPCLYKRRYILINEFVKRIEEEEENVELYIVEMIYPGQKFIITDENNSKHLQLSSQTPIWHKENMINLGVKYLLPSNYKAFAWIDSDIEFENNNWALDTLKILNGSKDIIQLFSHCVDMDKDETTLNLFQSFGYNYNKNKKYSSKKLDYWHPGFAWAITRKSYEKLGGLFQMGILGSGDNVIALSIIGKVKIIINEKYNDGYKNAILDYQKNAKTLRLGYVPGVIRHHFHGTKSNRKYVERNDILIKHNYSPILHLTIDEKGILIPTCSFIDEFKEDIMNYFRERKEDE
jgi:hypothetical protein